MDAATVRHPTDQTLNAYNLGKLEDLLTEAIDTHLETCPACRRRATELSADGSPSRPHGTQGRPGSTARVAASTTDQPMTAGGPTSPESPSSSTLPPGLADHPDYEILRELGRGGMGVVYLARNRLMERQEVLKLVGGHLVNRPGVSERFLGEIRNAARLHHPNIVTAYSAFRLDDSLVLAMEYLEGYDLARLVQANGPLAVAHACNFIHQAALGLQHAHEHGMVHRDIKPGNLMLTSRGYRAVVKILDFGLAKLRRERPADGTITHAGQLLGTPGYMAPEQISDPRHADIRADIYSLGCTLYHLLSGSPPFERATLYEIFQAHHSMEAMPLNLARPDVPVELAALVAKMMAKEPDRRFQAPIEVSQALKPFFKPGELRPGAAIAPLSQGGQPVAGRRRTEVSAAGPMSPTTDGTPAPSIRGPVLRTPKQPGWAPEGSIEAEPGRRGRPWLWPSVAAAVLLLGCVMAWGLRSSPGRTGGAASPAEAGRGQARADESLPPATGPGIAAPVVKPVSREPSSAPGLNELKQVGEIRPQAVPGPAGARPTSPTPVHPDRARPAAVDGESLVAAATREGHPDRPGTPRFDLALLKRPVRAKVALEMILAAPGSHSNRVVVPAGMYHLGPPRPDRPGGLWKCSVTEVNEPEFRSRRNDRPKVDSSFSTDLTLEPSLAEHLNKVVQKEQEKLAILSVWVTHSGACVLVKVEILERVICGVKRGYKHQPDIDYETRVVTPEGGKVVKGNDEEWEQVGRLRSLANEYKQRFRAYVEKLRHAGPDDVVVQMPPPSMPEALLPPVPPGMGGGGGPLIVVVPGWLSSSEATTVQGDPAPAPADGPGRVATNRPGSPPPSPGAPANPGGRTPTRIEPPHSANWAPLTRAPLIGRRLGPGYSGQQVQSGSLPGLPSPPGANSGVPAGGHSLDPGHFGQHNQHGSLPGLQPSPGTINGAPATGHSPGPGHDGQHSQAGSLPNHQPSPSSQPGAPTAHAPSHDSNSKK